MDPVVNAAFKPEPSKRAVEAIAGAWYEARRGEIARQAAAITRIADAGKRTLEQRGRELVAELDRQLDAHAKLGAVPPLFLIMGRPRDERPHNRVLAWLLDPEAEHGAARSSSKPWRSTSLSRRC